MSDIARSVGKFLYRDVFYIVSGLIIIIAASQIFRIRIPAVWSGEVLTNIALVAVAYALGLLNQEVWSQTPFVKTCRRRAYHPLLLGIYRRHMGEEWEYRPTDSKVITDDPDYQRAVNLKQIACSLGAALLTSSALLGVAAVSKNSSDMSFLALAALLFSLLFILMSWLHNMRQAAFKTRFHDALSASAPKV